MSYGNLKGIQRHYQYLLPVFEKGNIQLLFAENQQHAKKSKFCRGKQILILICNLLQQIHKTFALRYIGALYQFE